MARICRVLIPVVAAGLLVSGCTVSKTERPPLAGPSELGLSLSVTANPDIIPQNASQSQVVILALDGNGQAVKGLPIRLSLNPVVGQLSASDVTTGGDGRAAVAYTAPPLPPDNRETTVTISATPVSTDYSNAVPRSVIIRLVLPDVVPPLPDASFTFWPGLPAPNSTVTFDGTASSSQTGTIVVWSWDFGDGTTGKGARVQHVYRTAGDYNVSLSVTDNNGRTCPTPFTQVVPVSASDPPTAAFVFSPTAPAVAQTIFFNASNSTAGTGRTIVDFAWDFGNGSTQRGVSAATSYPAAGTYNVMLTVTDDLGQRSTKTQTVTVR